jgi:PIN domain nuclease of toxin-antitoxin system
VGAYLKNILLDTHALLWWLEDRDRLSLAARDAIEDPDNKAFVSAASAWEIAIKQRLGKLQAAPILADFERIIEEEGFSELPITMAHALHVGLMKSGNKDPFDQLLASQAQLESLSIVSADKFFDRQSVHRIW